MDCFIFKFLPQKGEEPPQAWINGFIYTRENVLHGGTHGEVAIYRISHKAGWKDIITWGINTPPIQQDLRMFSTVVIKSQEPTRGKFNPAECINEAGVGHRYYQYGGVAGDLKSSDTAHYVVTPFNPGCTLKNFKFKSVQQFIEVTKSILKETDKFHKLDLVHMDLQSSNFIINAISEYKHEVSLIDFGTSGLAGDRNIYGDRLIIQKDIQDLMLMLYSRFREDFRQQNPPHYDRVLEFLVNHTKTPDLSAVLAELVSFEKEIFTRESSRDLDREHTASDSREEDRDLSLSAFSFTSPLTQVSDKDKHAALQVVDEEKDKLERSESATSGKIEEKEKEQDKDKEKTHTQVRHQVDSMKAGPSTSVFSSSGAHRPPRDYSTTIPAPVSETTPQQQM